MGKNLVEELHISVETFKAFQKSNYPQVTEENDNGEWEIGLTQWEEMNSVYLKMIKNGKPEAMTDELLDDMLYVIARDNECCDLLTETLNYPDWLELLCIRSIHTNYQNAKWQFAQQLGEYRGESDITELLFCFIESGDEYTERMALWSMCQHFPKQAEEYAVKFWERNIYSADEYQKLMALDVLYQINSPLLQEYIARASQTEYNYLKKRAAVYALEAEQGA